MPLDVNKWIPETILRAINYAGGTMEFSAHLAADPSRKGKTFVIEPKTEVQFQVKELIPVSLEELRKLTGKDITFNMHNRGPENAKFTIIDDGPYYSEVMTRKYENEPQMVIDYYQESIKNSDYYRIRDILKEPVKEQWKVSPGFYAGACFLRGQMYRSFLRLPESEAAFEAALEGFDENQKWVFCFDWIATLLAYLIMPNATTEQKGKAFQKAIEVLKRIDDLTEGMKYRKYQRIATASVRAFILCYLDEHEQALAQFDDFDFTPIPLEEYKEKELDQFFRYLAYGFWAAIELKNAALLRNLSSIISTGWPDMLREPSPIRCFRRAFGNANERGRDQMDIETANLAQHAHSYAPEFPNLRQFVLLLNSKDDVAIDSFIGYVE